MQITSRVETAAPDPPKSKTGPLDEDAVSATMFVDVVDESFGETGEVLDEERELLMLGFIALEPLKAWPDEVAADEKKPADNEDDIELEEDDVLWWFSWLKTAMPAFAKGCVREPCSIVEGNFVHWETAGGGLAGGAGDPFSVWLW